MRGLKIQWDCELFLSGGYYQLLYRLLFRQVIVAFTSTEVISTTTPKIDKQ